MSNSSLLVVLPSVLFKETAAHCDCYLILYLDKVKNITDDGNFLDNFLRKDKEMTIHDHFLNNPRNPRGLSLLALPELEQLP